MRGVVCEQVNITGSFLRKRNVNRHQYEPGASLVEKIPDVSGVDSAKSAVYLE